jgi:hypothetical protein
MDVGYISSKWETRKRSDRVLKKYLGICPKGLRKIIKGSQPG